jgi:hypothetical protein
MPGEENAAGPWQGAAAGEDGAQDSASVVAREAPTLGGEVIPPQAAAAVYAPSQAELDDLRDEVKAAYAELQASVRTTVDKAVALGRVLLKAKERIGHGRWLNWLDRHTKIKRGMAAKYMTLALGQQEYIARDFQRIKNLGVAAGAAELTRWYREERRAEREEAEQEREQQTKIEGQGEATSPVPAPRPERAPAAPSGQLVDDLLGDCFTWRRNHPEATDQDILGALKEVCRLVERGALDPGAEEVWEKKGGLSDGRHVLFLTPSDLDGYTHYAVLDLVTGEIRGRTRPVRDDALEMVVTATTGLPMPTRWSYARSARHRENPHLIDSESVLTDEQEAVLAEPPP